MDTQNKSILLSAKKAEGNALNVAPQKADYIEIHTPTRAQEKRMRRHRQYQEVGQIVGFTVVALLVCLPFASVNMQPLDARQSASLFEASTSASITSPTSTSEIILPNLQINLGQDAELKFSDTALDTETTTPKELISQKAYFQTKAKSGQDCATKLCANGLEIEAFEQGRIYAVEGTAVQIASTNTEKQSLRIGAKTGRLWLRAPVGGVLEVDLTPYRLVLADGAIADVIVKDSTIELTTIRRATQITFLPSVNETLEEKAVPFELVPRRTISLARSTTTATIDPFYKEFPTEDTWLDARMLEERAWFQSLNRTGENVSFNSGIEPNKLKKYLSFLIISPVKRSEVNFPYMDEKLATLSEKLAETGVLPVQTSGEFRTLAQEAASHGELSLEATKNYLITNWYKLWRVRPSNDDSSQANKLFGLKKFLEETYLQVSASPRDWQTFRWQDTYLVEDLINEFNIVDAAKLFKTYRENCERNVNTAELSELPKQINYIEEIFLTSAPYISVEMWEDLFVVENTYFHSPARAEAKLALGSTLAMTKLRQIVLLWQTNQYIKASLVAKTLLGGYSTPVVNGEENETLHYGYFTDHLEEIFAGNPNIKVIFSQTSETLNRAVEYRPGATGSYEPTQEDLFAKDFYTEYLDYLERERASYYQRPPTAQDIVNELAAYGVIVSNASRDLISTTKPTHNSVTPIQGWIELINNSSETISLDGWYVTNKPDADYDSRAFLSGSITPTFTGLGDSDYTYVAVDIDPASLELTRAGQTLYLYSEPGKLVQKISYPAVGKDYSYALQENGTYTLTTPTKQKANTQVSATEKNKKELPSGVVISEIAPYDAAKFHIQNIILGNYNFDIDYDHDMKIFSNLVADTETLELMRHLTDEDQAVAQKADEAKTEVPQITAQPEEIKETLDNALGIILPNTTVDTTTLSEGVFAQTVANATKMANNEAIPDRFTLSNFLALPTRLDQIKQKYIYNGKQLVEIKNESPEAALKMLKNIIIDHLRISHMQTTLKDMNNCNSVLTAENLVPYTECDVVASTYHPIADLDVSFTFHYNIQTAEATDIRLSGGTKIADKLNIVYLRQAVLQIHDKATKTKNAQEEAVKKLKSWGITVEAPQVALKTEGDYNIVIVNNVTYKNTNTKSQEKYPEFKLQSASYDIEKDVLSDLVFEGNKVVKGEYSRATQPEESKIGKAGDLEEQLTELFPVGVSRIIKK